MSNLYFKDSNGEFHPIDVECLDIKPNSLVMMQFTDNKYHPSHDDLERVLQLVETLVEERGTKNVDFMILAHPVRIEILDRDKDLENKEILIDISKVEGKNNQDYIKHLLGDSLKKFHHEFVRLPIKAGGGNA